MHTTVLRPATDPSLRFAQRVRRATQNTSSTPDSSSLPLLLQSPEACQYRELNRAFRASGGIVSSEEILTLLMRHTSQPISRLAHWIVDHEVISFPWQSRTMLPLFQFDLATMTLRPPVSAVVHELAPALGDWDICLWFVAPNAWLADASPLEAIAQDAPAVLDAARGERYLLRA